jgi:uncharacterized protein (DUF4415 family)
MVSYTAEDLRDLPSKTDWSKVDAKTEAELEAAIASDVDWRDIPSDWHKAAKPGLPFPLPKKNKRQVTLRLDPDVLDHFKRQGRGWQSRINAVLKTFMIATEHDRGRADNDSAHRRPKS